MSTPITFNGSNYNVPSFGDGGYAQGSGNLSLYLVALSTGTLQQSGGSFPLTADANFGPNFGLIALYYKSVTANIATAGQIRLAKTDTIDWRNNANSANLALGIDGSDNLTFNGTPLAVNGGGTVNTGTAGQLAYYATSGTAVSGNPLITTSNAAFTGLLSANSLRLLAASNQINLLFGGTNQVFITMAAPAATRTYTIPDTSTTIASFVMTEGAQTISGTTTFASTAFIGTNIILKTASSGVNDYILFKDSANGTVWHLEYTDSTGGLRLYGASTAYPLTFTNAITVSGGIVGTTTNNNATAGNVGEYIPATGTSVTLTDSTYIDVASIVLTAGDWDISAVLEVTPPAAGITAARIGISTTAGNSSAGLTSGDTQIIWNMVTTATSATGMSLPNVRASLSGSTTYYLKGLAQSTGAGNATGTGRISARRIR